MLMLKINQKSKTRQFILIIFLILFTNIKYLLQVTMTEYEKLFYAILRRDKRVNFLLNTPHAKARYISMLLDAGGVDPNRKRGNKTLALQHAVAMCNWEDVCDGRGDARYDFDSYTLCKILLEKGAKVDGISANCPSTPLCLASELKYNTPTIKLLLDAGADVHGDPSCEMHVSTESPLHLAAHAKNCDGMRLLLNAGASIDRRTISRRLHLGQHFPKGCTPLHYAACRYYYTGRTITVHSYSEILMATLTLINAGADVNAENWIGHTPLFHAVKGHVDVVTALLDAGANPLHTDCRGMTALQVHFLYYKPYKKEEISIALVKAGDRDWKSVPIPCPGIESIMFTVWQAAPGEIHEIVKRMESPPQSIEELLVRLNDTDTDMQDVIQATLDKMPPFPREVIDNVIDKTFDFKFSAAAAASAEAAQLAKLAAAANDNDDDMSEDDDGSTDEEDMEDADTVYSSSDEEEL
jgi:hypothetical protein